MDIVESKIQRKKRQQLNCHEYYKNNQEKISKRHKKNYQNDKKRILRRNKTYRQNNKEQIAKQKKELYIEKNGELVIDK